MGNKKHIVVTGPESTGKSTLAAHLASKFGGVLVEEYARAYLQEKGGSYDRSDLSAIAFGQFQAQLAAVNQVESELVISDTCLLTIRIWDEWKYEMSDDFVEEWIGLQEVDFYLLCSPDLPWEADSLRESQHDREELFEIYLENVLASGVPFSIIEGTGDARHEEAEHILSTVLEL